MKGSIMINLFGGSSGTGGVDYSRHQGGGNLPVPFNIPSVLYKLLYEDTGIEFNAKQKDILTTLQFSYKSLGKMEMTYAQKEQDIRAKILEEADNEKYPKELEMLQLERFEANQHFKELVIVLSDLLNKDQYEKLLKYCNIPV